MDAHEGSLLECLVLILDRKSNLKVRGCAREHVCLEGEEVCMGVVVIGGGGCLQTTAFLVEGLPLPSNAVAPFWRALAARTG